jgi:hypothetical protein
MTHVAHYQVTDILRAAFALYEHELKCSSVEQDRDGFIRATVSMQSLARTIVFMVKPQDGERPLDYDTLSSWSHRVVYLACMAHIKYGERNEEWKSGIQLCKDYLQYFVPRYTNYCMFGSDMKTLC